MFHEVKQNLFTIHGLIVTVIHMMIIIGGISSYLFFRIQFMGEDASISFPTGSAMSRKLK